MDKYVNLLIESLKKLIPLKERYLIAWEQKPDHVRWVTLRELSKEMNPLIEDIRTLLYELDMEDITMKRYSTIAESIATYKHLYESLK